MAKPRDRYIISGNMSTNGKSLKDITVVDMGLCSSSGTTKTKDGKKLSKNDLTHRKFKFENLKLGKELGLSKSLMEFTLSPEHMAVFLTKQTEDNT